MMMMMMMLMMTMMAAMITVMMMLMVLIAFLRKASAASVGAETGGHSRCLTSRSTTARGRPTATGQGSWRQQGQRHVPALALKRPSAPVRRPRQRQGLFLLHARGSVCGNRLGTVSRPCVLGSGHITN